MEDTSSSVVARPPVNRLSRPSWFGSKSSKEGGLLDAQVGIPGGPSSGLARFWDAWGGAYALSDTLISVACLSMAALIGVSWVRRRRRPDVISPSRGTVWMLGTTLVVCGFSLLIQAIVVAPRDRLVGTPLLAAVACWAAALALRSPAVRTPVVEPVANGASEVAERGRLEEDLRHSREEMRRFVEADARKNAFLAILGHELRNSLAPIRNALRIMKRRGSDDPDLCWARDVVEHQLHQLGQLVDDLQEISRVTSGKVRLEKEPVDVATIVVFAVETSRPTIDAHHHRLSIALPPGPVLVEADSIRMAQVLSNLLNNAAKYTEEGGHIRLAVRVEDEQVVFRVRDDGIGIAEEMLSSVFDLFTQVDHSLDRSQGGLGLGLTLVRSLVEMHGGSVQAASEGLGKGSEFMVRLPIWKAEEKLVAEPPPVVSSPSGVSRPAANPDPRSRKVLVVDDNVTSAQSLELLLTLEGHEVQVVHDGPSVLQAVSHHHHEVVLMDIGLPGMSGYEVARQLRQQPELGNLLLVAVTGYAEDEARRLSREAGFDHHLVKPVDPDAILALLASLEWSEPHDHVEPFKPKPSGVELVDR
jgi:signal transduction histidine kinase/CheY-like chemotaxis protein